MFIQLLFLVLLSVVPSQPFSIANILKANYSAGTAFQQMSVTKSDDCMCACYSHPHCLSIGVTRTVFLTCRLFATYPSLSSHLSSSSISNVTIYVDRTLISVYNNNSTKLSNPSKLFSNNTQPWTPIFKLFTGNNRSFLSINSTNSTTLTPIPSIPVNTTAVNWYSILVAQWTQGAYKPNQVAMAFIVNRSFIIDFIIFNASQSNVISWLTMPRLVSTQFWPILSYAGSTQDFMVESIYTDNSCIRSFNCNYKSNSSCSMDFYGYFFVHGGYLDTCIAAATKTGSVRIPSIFVAPTTTITSGNISEFTVADGLMIFVR